MRPTIPAFSQLMLRIYSLAQSTPLDRFQDEVLEELKRSVNFDSCMWGTATIAPAGIDVHSIHLHNSSTDMLLAYEKVKHEDDAVQIMVQQPRCTMTFRSHEINAGPERRGMYELCERFGHRNTLITSDFNPLTRFAQWISLYRRDAAAHYVTDEEAFVSEIAQHLMQALAINRLVQLDRMVKDQARAQWSVAIADRRGVIYHADEIFRRLVRTDWPSSDSARLPKELLAGLADASGRVVGAGVVVQRSLEHGVLFLKARQRQEIDGLTPRELAVARLVAQGLTQKEVAERTGKSQATIHSQMKSVFDKLGINNAVLLAPMLALYD